MIFIRWLLVPVSAALVVAVVIYAGLLAVDIADGNCAADSFAAGSCVAAWHTTALETIIYAGVVLTAIGLALVPSLIAPKLKVIVSVFGLSLVITPLAAAVLLSGSLPIPIIVPGDATMPLIAAIGAGGLAVFWVRSRARRDAS